jgi:hypothetical protein
MLRGFAIQHRRIGGLLVVGLFAAALLALTGRRAQCESVLATIAFFSPIVVGVLSMSGIVSDDIESGLVVMWQQKAGALRHIYVTRYLVLQSLVLAFALAVGAIIGIIGYAAGSFTVGKALRLPIGMAILGVLPAAIVFALSAWRARRDSAIAVIIIVASVSLGASFAFDDSVTATVMKAIAFPIDPLQAIVEWPRYGASLLRPFGIVIGQLVAWTAVAAIGLRQLEARTFEKFPASP